MQVISIFDARSAYRSSRSREAVLKCTTKNKKRKEVGTPDGGCFYIEGGGGRPGQFKNRGSFVCNSNLQPWGVPFSGFGGPGAGG